MNEALTLISRVWSGNDWTETTRDVLCGVRNVGYREFYEANATDFHPEMKFVLADYLDYQNETLCKYNGTTYRILRTYRTGQEIELTAERAADEEAVE